MLEWLGPRVVQIGAGNTSRDRYPAVRMVLFSMALALGLQTQISQLPRYLPKQPNGDWLLGAVHASSGVYAGREPDEIVLSNGLISRTFKLTPDAATVGIQDLRTGQELLRGVLPEARITLNGKLLDVGGLNGQPDLAYLRPDWLKSMTVGDGLHFKSFEVGNPVARLPWKRVRASPDTSWPPKGASLTLNFEDANVRVGVHYEIYDSLPVVSKWITVINGGAEPVHLDKFSSELLRFVEGESLVDNTPGWRLPNVTVLTDYWFGGMAVQDYNRTAYWEPDPAYTTQVNYLLQTPCILEMKPPLGPSVDIGPGESVRSFTSFELFHDSTDRERKGLELRKMYRALAPWCMENPLMLHLTSVDPTVVHEAIDQAAECGFEMVIISFGAGLDMEDVSYANIAKFRGFREYANSKGLELGGYSLLASRHIDDANDVINPKTGKTGGAIFGDSPCLGSKWGIEYFRKLEKFISETGFQLLENDGSYPGDVCASTTHPGHKGLEDSQWTQYAEIAAFYRWCKERGVFLNVPDNYFFAGSNKTGMGYREDNWSLPRDQQHIHARQNLFDGTWDKTPSMGWMFVPLVEYHGGGAAATIEPLKDHLQDYELHLANNLGYGAQACYRGFRLFDAPETKAAVVKWVHWFKKHRPILESDVIHVRRADGQRLDCILHANPALPERGMAVVYNPLDTPLEEDIELPLYFTGLVDHCHISTNDGHAAVYTLDRDYKIKVKLRVAGRSCSWLSIRE